MSTSPVEEHPAIWLQAAVGISRSFSPLSSPISAIENALRDAVTSGKPVNLSTDPMGESFCLGRHIVTGGRGKGRLRFEGCQASEPGFFLA
jgi:hypothetical protein